MDFAPELDLAFYRAQHADLAAHSDADLAQHYRLHGKTEGRRSSPLATRDGFLPALARCRPALEIGPFWRPCLQGSDVSYLDVLDTEALRRRATSVGGDPTAVPNIDYVGSLHDVRKHFELVFSSHSIEHQPDLIRHLQEVAAALETGGLYALIIPDCRFCFDHFLPPSNVAEAMEAYRERRTHHTLRKVIEHRALTTHNDPLRHWKGDHGSQKLKFVDAAVEEHSSGHYVDVHAWQFTPESFRAITSYFASITGLSPVRIYDTPFGHPEFCAILKK